MSGSKRVFQLSVVPAPAKREGLLTGLPGFEAMMGDEELHREFENLLKPALDWFRYGKGLYFIYTDRTDDFWRTRLVPTVEQFLLFPVTGPISGKMDQKLWRWLREVLQFCAFERGDRIFVWPAGKPESVVSGEVAGFTATGRPSINFDNPMKAFPLDGNFEFGREHPVPDKPSDETVLSQRGDV
jgi:hypothetical protein